MAVFNDINFVDSSSVTWSTPAVPLGGSVTATATPTFFGSVGIIGSGSPADTQTYYLATAQIITAITTSSTTSLRFYAPYACTINRAFGAFRVTGTLGTTETGTLFLRKNDTTNTNISTSVVLNASDVVVSATNLNITLAAGDYLTWGFTTPAWATNPTGVGFAGTFST